MSLLHRQSLKAQITEYEKDILNEYYQGQQPSQKDTIHLQKIRTSIKTMKQVRKIKTTSKLGTSPISVSSTNNKIEYIKQTQTISISRSTSVKEASVRSNARLVNFPVQKHFTHSEETKKQNNQVKKMPLSFIERTQQINQGLHQKWMSDPVIRSVFVRFNKVLVSFLKTSMKKGFTKIMKLIEFKIYLRQLFFSENSSIIKFINDLDFDYISKKAFSISLYDHFLNERYTLNQIQFFKLMQRKIKQGLSQEETAQLKSLNIPTYSEFIKNILIVDLTILTQKLDEYMIKKQTDNISVLGEDINQCDKQIEDLYGLLARKEYRKMEQNGRFYPISKYFPKREELISFQGANGVNLVEEINKLEQNQGPLSSVSDANRCIYNKLQHILTSIQKKDKQKAIY